jgi:UDP-N-acetylglucosamine acyltransferase
MNWIHPTAIVNPKANLGSQVRIGPYCVVDAQVTLEENVELISHVCVSGLTQIGPFTRVFPFASIGHPPQDLKYRGELSQVKIGSHNTIREYVTIQPGTAGDRMLTRIGNHCLLMVSTHVAHDCWLGDSVIMANQATLAGHITIEDHAIIGGLSAIRQFVRIGKYAIIGGMSGVEKDVIPYGLVMGERAFLQGLNLVGLKRHHFSSEIIQTLQQIYKDLFETTEKPFSERLCNLQKQYIGSPEIEDFFRFFEHETKTNYCLPRSIL